MKKKYLEIYDKIRSEIRDGSYTAGELLPSEHELSTLYQTSRETIRKALNQLSEHGFIQKQQGRGSIVLDVEKFNFPVSGLVSFQELSPKLGENVVTEVTAFYEDKCDSHAANQLEVAEAEPIWRLNRVREVDGERIILDKDILLQRVLPDLTSDIAAGSLYEYMEEELDYCISFAKKEITVEEATEEDRVHLDLEQFASIVLVKNYVYLENATLFQYTESRHRTDRFRFVDFARRR
ncbi:trehalose operon repressor [Salsuginibacillus kocurii]|uniref:trehalose operon repressor n=1 Tax=Salsuginibacillus kocurii TaxID=427078 RepID=UPI0003762305|nr:trehalose operon repressor [Salsuginibacillus kocurii]